MNKIKKKRIIRLINTLKIEYAVFKEDQIRCGAILDKIIKLKGLL